HLVVEISGIAEPANDHARAGIARGAHRKRVERGYVEGGAGLVGDGPEGIGHEPYALLGTEQSLLVMMGADGDNEAVDEVRRPRGDVDMAEGHGVEAAGVEADSRHRHLLAAPSGSPQGPASSPAAWS